MKKVNCSLIQGRAFHKNAAVIAKDFCEQHGLVLSVELRDLETLQFEFSEQCNNDLIIKILTNLFEGLGGVEVNWDIFGEPVSIY